MMRWNSTKTYTEDDILRMQQEAVMRVHEFQSRAKALPFYDVPESAITPYQDPPAQETPYYDAPPAAQEPMEPEQPPEPEQAQEEAQTPEPVMMPPPGQQDPVMNQPIPMNQPANQPMHGMANSAPADPITGILSKLNLDGETLLILGLMFLLYNEKADNVLLIALAYLLL